MKNNLSSVKLLARAAAVWCAAVVSILPAQAAMLKSAQVTAVVNEVNLIEPTGSERVAKVEEQVRGDQGVRTGVKSRAELLFQDKTLTRLGASTIFTFTGGTRDLELERGTLLLQAPKGSGGARVRTAAVTAAITGTTILLEYSPAPWMTGPGKFAADIAKVDPEQAARELKKPRRNYSAAELAELKRRSKMPKKNRGYVKVMVLEGTLRLFLNTRVGESTLVKAGEMIILSPDAFQIPPPVQFDIARLAQTSLLVNNRFWGSTATDLNMVAVNREVGVQSKLISKGDLIETNLVIPGGGTNIVLAQLNQDMNQGVTTNPVVLAATEPAPPSPPSSDGGNPPSIVAQSGAPASAPRPNTPGPGPGPVPELPGFQVSGSTTVVSGGAPPPSSKDLGGNFQTVTSLPGEVPVLPTEGNDFVIFSTGGQSAGDPPQDLTATQVTRSLKIPGAPAGSRVGLSFDYRFFSNEVDQGASFPDQFNVTITSGDESIVLALDRNALSPGGTGVLTPVGQAGVGGYDGGTDWLPFLIDLTPFKGKNATVSFHIWDVGDAVVDSAFAVDDFNIGAFNGTPGAPAIPGSLTLNLKSVTLGSASGEYAIPNLEGLPARNDAGPAADVGTFIVNSPGAITVNGPLNASTGKNGANTVFGGRGGNVQLNSTAGEVTINASIKVSESSVIASTASGGPITAANPGKLAASVPAKAPVNAIVAPSGPFGGTKASAAGGSIKVNSGKGSGPAITITNTGELLALLNAAAPGPGGRIEVTSAGGDIRVNGGRVIADRGTIDVRNTGAAGIIQINAAQLAADVLKVGALGTNGQLTITAGSQLSAASTLQLYGGSGDLGRVLFTGSGTVNISGNPIHIAGKTVEVSAATHVNNSGPTNVHTDNALFGVGAGGGKFGNPVNTGPLSGAPAF